MRLSILFLLAACGRTEQTIQPGDEADPSDVEDGGEAGEGAGDDPDDEQQGEDDPGDPDDDEDPEDEDPDDELPSEYTYDEEEVEPLLSLPEVEDAMELGFRTIMGADPNDVFEVFQDVLADGDADRSCPYWYETYYELYGYDYWYGGCTSDSDIYYDGSIYGIDYEPYSSGYYNYHRNAWWYGDWGAEYPDGQRWDISGYFRAYDYTYTYYPYRVNYLGFTGDVGWTGDDYEHTWFAGGASVDFAMSTMDYPAYGSYVTISGGMSSLSGDATTIHFTDFYIGTQGYSDCEDEPSGTISIRDSDGEWYQAVFDGPAYDGAEVFPPDCDGCGEVWFRGEKLGEVCPAFTVFTDWSETPW